MAVFILGVLGVMGTIWSAKVDNYAFAQQAKDASGAMYFIEDGKQEFGCSGTLIGFDDHGNGLFLTARHCVWSDGEEDGGEGAGLIHKPITVSFSDNEIGPFYAAVPIKVSSIDDVALLAVFNVEPNHAYVKIGSEFAATTDDKIMNYSFALSAGKTGLPVFFIENSFGHMPLGIHEEMPKWDHAMFIGVPAAPGSSGSGIIDLTQKRLIGVVVGHTPYGSISVAIPVSRVWNFLADPKSEDLTVVQHHERPPVILGTFK